MFEQIIMGIIQGIAEWLPISSEGLIILIKSSFFSGGGIENMVKQALFLHLGTFFAALIYFRKEIISLIQLKSRKLLVFLVTATLISGLLGYGLLNLLANLPARTITLVIGLLLLLTAGFQLKAKKGEYKERNDLTVGDGILLGLVQGASVLPGLSRSGLTVSTLLLRKFKSSEALTLSFLMSLPVVLGGNIVLNLDKFVLSSELVWGLIFSFIFGFLTIDLLLKLSKKINFGYFVLFFGLIVIASVFVL